MSQPLNNLVSTRKSSRIHTASSYLNDYICSNVKANSQQISLPSTVNLNSEQYSILCSTYCHHTITNGCSIPKHVSFSSLQHQNQQLLALLTTQQEPQMYNKGITDPAWKNAMQKEFQALATNQTWDLVPLPKGKRPIRYKWIYKIKYKDDGSVKRYKTRLVVKGYTQNQGIDYT